ncbi:S8 family peptidase [Clostridium sp. 'White wine YQ']|uniref:S8 family peptidase n=1 Tax=Clostridium sp. 'White wine YQ' TaxID=3027474 RepID=UPI002365CD3A|nr:S8 family peptidase [Clostridium sp. 'White wine YQ']MDD7794198.1 S8 family peptidase [Clostridium sp. 'White wine YQ']
MFNIERREKVVKPEEVDQSFPWKDAYFIVVEYQGDIANSIKSIPNARVIIIDDRRAVLASTGDIYDVINKLSKIIVSVSLNALFTLCDISPLTASQADLFHTSPYLKLDGTGVIIGIIDTGIDYLNEEFMNEDGTTRIVGIFDENLRVEYTSDEINEAVNAKKQGKDPYAIVPSKDLIGHGTSIAGVAAARGVNPAVVGVAPRAMIAVVNMAQANIKLREEQGVYGNAPVYSSVSIFLGIQYLNRLSLFLNVPMIMLIPLGSNIGPRNGLTTTERYLDEVSTRKGVTCVIPTGNQGIGDNHTSGIIGSTGESSNIELKIDPNQKDIRFEIWCSKPDKISLSIVSPSGEVIDRIPPASNKVTNISFLYEGTKMSILYLLPETQTGDERILITARDIKEGIWIFKLTGDLVVVGRYDSYLNSKELLAPETKFLKPDPFITLTSPSTSRAAISVAYYDQNDNSNVAESGKGYTRDNRIKPEIAAGGINALATTIGGGTRIISGSSVAAAVVAGCAALINQWGEVEGNDPSMYSTKVKTYLIRGASKREGDTYPNQDWGYGTVDMKGVFDNIRHLVYEDRGAINEDNEFIEFYKGNLFIRIPNSSIQN